MEFFSSFLYFEKLSFIIIIKFITSGEDMPIKFINLVLIISLLLSSTAFAQQINVEYRPNVKVVIDEKLVEFKDTNGQTIYPIMYKGITYIPIKTIAEIIGKNYTYNKYSETVNLNGSLTPKFTEAINNTQEVKNVLAEFKPELKIILDNSKDDFINLEDPSTYPLDFNGNIYVPTKVVSSIMNKEITWNRETATVYLGQRNDLFTSLINEPLETSFFKYTINSATSLSSIGIVFPDTYNKFVIVNVTVTNILPETLPMYYDDFQIKWGESAAEMSNPIYSIILGNKLKNKFYLKENESVTGNLVFEVPSDKKDLKLEYIEVFDNSLVGSTYQIKFKVI